MKGASRSATYLEGIAWLTDRLLLAVVRLDVAAGDASGLSVLASTPGGEAIELDAHWLDTSALSGDGATRLWLVTAKVPEAGAANALETISIRVPSSNEALLSAPIDSAAAGEVASAFSGDLDPEARIRAQQFFAETPSRHAFPLDRVLAENLNALRDRVRQPLPSTEAKPGPMSARLEYVTRLSDRAFWVTGWVHHANPKGTSFTAVSPEGERRRLPPGAVTFHPRPSASETLEDNENVTTLGYHALVQLKQPSQLERGWLIEFEMADGQWIEHATQSIVSEDTDKLLSAAREALKGEILDEAVLEHQLLPFYTLRRGGSHEASVGEVLNFGDVNQTPDVSVVVAVRRVDRIQHQLGEFARDPDLADAELLFVAVDAGGRLDETAEELHELYDVPFRLVKLTRPTRRQRAYDLGSSVARGRLLALLSSDVLPAGPGWVTALRVLHDSSPEIGAVGPKLLREDDSIAQAGIEFAQRRATGRWKRTLPLAGLARSLPAAGSARKVHAVSDSCMMVSTEDFRALEGFSELYLGETDEGVDLCLRLSGSGLQTWYCPEAELYLLDQPDKPRKPSPARDQFNEWLFGQRCAALLTPISRDEAAFQPAKASAFIPPPIPNHGSRRPGSPIEMLELTEHELDDELLLDAHVQLIETGNQQPVVYEGTYAFAITGWAIPRKRGPVTIQVRGGVRDLRQMNAKLPSPRLAEKYPDVPGADNAAFQFVIGTLSLPAEFELEIDAVTEDGSRVALGSVRGRRRPMRSAYKPAVQPLLVTMTGRSGSNWMITLLGSHPEIVAFQPFVYEPQLASYWMAMLRALADPASYMQALQPELYEWDWWTGNGRKSPLPLRKPTADMARWFGTENVEVLAGFCQSRLDAFYGHAAQLDGGVAPRYFTEKSVPGTARLLGELYPDLREIVLVRDFRDRICSILDYNAKRNLSLWGREKAQTDEEWFLHLRNEAQNLLEGWLQRKDHAHLVRYEDLIREPESTLTGVFEYLQVDSSAETVGETITRANETAPGQQERHRTASSVEESIGRWKRELSPEQQAAAGEAFDDILVEFGYEPTKAELSAASSQEGTAPTA